MICDLEVVCKGFYGYGLLEWLVDEFFIDMEFYFLWILGDEGVSYVVFGSEIVLFISFLVLVFEVEGGMVDGIVELFEYVFYLVFGIYKFFNFMVNKEGLGTVVYFVDDDEFWVFDLVMGEVVYD